VNEGGPGLLGGCCVKLKKKVTLVCGVSKETVEREYMGWSSEGVGSGCGIF
jgi:hypothetical protein